MPLANDERPLFVQVAERMEDAILAGAYEEETQIPSTTEISTRYKINPATALKGINILVEGGAVYKKRGVGMFVKKGATEALRAKRRDQFYLDFVLKLAAEGKKLGVSLAEAIAMVERGYENGH